MNAQPDLLAIGDTILSWCSQCTEAGMPTEHRFEGNKLTCLECNPDGAPTGGVNDGRNGRVSDEIRDSQ